MPGFPGQSAMPVLRLHHDKCPCGSGRLIKDCCLKPCGDLRPIGVLEEYEHPRCYAKGLGKCSRTISGEHWISANLLRTIEPVGHLTVGGLPWRADGELQHLPINALQSNMLCQHHNSALSPLDGVAGRFFGAFPSIKVRPRPSHNLHLFLGVDFERWMLKCVCGGIFSGALRSPVGRLADWRPPRPWLDFVFAGSPMPAPLGLYFCQEVGDCVECENPIELACIAKDADVHGITLRMHGFQFILATVPPTTPLPDDSLLTGAVHRPSEFVISGSDGQIVLHFDWGPNHQGGRFNISWSPKS